MLSALRLSSGYHRALHVVLDVVALLLAWNITIGARIALNGWMAAKLTPQDMSNAAPPAVAVVALWLVAAVQLQLYHAKSYYSIGLNLVRLVQAVAIVGSLIVAITLFSRQFNAELSRSLVILFVPVSLITLIVARYAVVLASARAGRKWSSAPRVAVLGELNEASIILKHLQSTSRAVEFTGVILPENASAHAVPGHVPVLGTTLEAAEVVNRERLDSVIILKSAAFDPDVERAGGVFARMGVTLSHAMQFAGPETQLEFNHLLGLPLVEIRALPPRHLAWRIKRSVDVVGSAVLLVALAPLLLIIALAIKLSSRGPVLYMAPRVGKGGRHFLFCKFRSMYTGLEHRGDLAHRNEKSGHIFKVKNDPRVTPVGRFLRRYSLDELPQLINVLLGDMSLVGPRPLPASDLGQDGMSVSYPEWAECRSRVTPGISGLWQVRGRSDVTFEEMVRFDMQYVTEWSLSLDVRILLETPLVVLLGRGAC